MNNNEFDKVNELDQEGRKEDAFDLLLALALKKHPLALFELSCRYFCTEDQWPEVLKIDRDIEKSKKLAEDGKMALEEQADKNDGEAMRMLAYVYFGHLGPHYKDVSKAENWLLKAIVAGCHFASNDLATFYQSTDKEKAKYWYQYAEEHKCRVVHNPELET